jgi:hypothetical protein
VSTKSVQLERFCRAFGWFCAAKQAAKSMIAAVIGNDVPEIAGNGGRTGGCAARWGATGVNNGIGQYFLLTEREVWPIL